ncbi:MAG TPA: ABC transporter permease [Bryobacteraceae bacterium]|nr:ABC transporter permease [Bryobacteraceae bacterium]
MPLALDTTLHDIRYAWRGIIRNPAFSLTAVLAAALGIGATSAVFSAIDRVLFRGLPYGDPDTLVSTGMLTPLDTNEFLFPDQYFNLRRDSGPFREVTAFQAGDIATDLTEDRPVRLHALRVGANFLHVLGIQPLAGRAFTRDEDRRGGPPVALISYGLWRARFAGDPHTVGRTLSLDGIPTEIVGILPREFRMPTLAEADVLLPLALNEATEHSGRALRVFARLQPGITTRQAAAALEPAFARALSSVPPAFRKEVSLRVRSLRDRQMGDARAASLALFGAVLAVLLIACANIASLLLARGVARRRELAVRTALGASRLRLARQALTESLILGALGGTLGCALAWTLLHIFVALAPAALPGLQDAAIDHRVLLFTICASLACGLLFGLAPALRRAASWLEAGWHTPRARGGLRAALVTLEIAFSMVLLTGAGLLIRSLWKLESVPLGIQTDHVIMARFVLGRLHYGRGEQQLAFFNELERRLAAAPGPDAFAITDSIPPSGGSRGRPFAAIDVEGQPRRPEGTGGMVGWRYVTPGYFSVLGIPIVRGRPFTAQDREPSAFAAILSETLARKLFPHADPIGRHILSGPQGQWTTVVGVARDVTNLGATRESWPEYYIVRKPAADFNFENQEPNSGWRSAFVIARTAISPRLAAGSIRAVLQSLDPALPVEIQTMDQRLREIDQRPRFYAILLGAFAGLGALLAAVGLFGVMSYLVAQRTREIGVRMALGATRAHIVRLTLATAARSTAAGVALGAIASVVAARLLRALLFHVRPTDPAAVAAAVIALCAVALIAAAAPARRAARLDPLETLRHE